MRRQSRHWRRKRFVAKDLSILYLFVSFISAKSLPKAILFSQIHERWTTNTNTEPFVANSRQFPFITDSQPIHHRFSTILDLFVADSRTIRYQFSTHSSLILDGFEVLFQLPLSLILNPFVANSRQFSTILKCYFSCHCRWFLTYSSPILDNLNPFIADLNPFVADSDPFSTIRTHSSSIQTLRDKVFTTDSNHSWRYGIGKVFLFIIYFLSRLVWIIIKWKGMTQISHYLWFIVNYFYFNL